MKCLKQIIAGCLALGMAACSGDEEIVGTVDNNGAGVAGQGGEVYATLTLNLPAKRAGETGGSAGVEFGKNYENKVGSVLVVLAEAKEDGSYAYVTSSLSDGALNSGTGTGAANNPKYTLVFQNEALKASGGKTIAVFAYANPTQALRNAIDALNPDDTFTDLTAVTNGTDIWTDNAFFMTSVGTIQSVTLDADIANSTAHNTPESALDLGVVPVERVAARFDYKQVNGNKYPITASIPDEMGEPQTVEVGDIVLTDMALINMATEYYYLPRTSADGKNTGISLCPGAAGMEMDWVVSPRYAEYLNYGTEQAPQLAADYFIYPMGNNADWEWTSIASLGKDDNDDSWNSGNEGTTTYGDYKIWRYAVENTIPRFGIDNYSAQKKGLTTGVVFKGHIDVTEEASPLYRAFNAGEDIYMFNEVIYGGVTELAKAVEASPVSALADAFNAAFNKVISGEGESQSVTYEKKEGVEMGKLGFTVYKKDVASGKYPVYYYYYNRHNNNDQNNVMGAMEFGVVRNNVYKLSVTGINRFGHPSTDPDDPDDPDPENPEDPDEDNKVYFKVSVEVLPWVVRVNNIEF